MNIVRFFFLSSYVLISLSCTDKKTKDAQIYERLCAEENWDLLAEKAEKNYLRGGDEFDMNYFHIAQAHRGKLVKELFRIKQLGTDGIWFEPSQPLPDPRSAYVFYTMGDFARAQFYATVALHVGNRLNGDMLKLLVKIELMRGNDMVADKYLYILGKKRKYRDWVRTVRENPDLERGAAYFKCEDSIVYENFEVFRIVDANPADSLAMQYGLALNLLSRNPVQIKEFIDRYYGTPALKELPVAAQEAIVCCPDFINKNPDYVRWCFEHGLKGETVQRFRDFSQLYASGNIFALMLFKNTFWFYFF